jgi:hypothetical protein
MADASSSDIISENHGRVSPGRRGPAWPARALAALALAGLLIAGCSSGGETGGPLPGISRAEAERDVEDGRALLSSTVTVRFDRGFELAESRVPLASHFELDIPLATGGSHRALVASAERREGDPRAIVLKVDEVVPAGATLRVAKRAFQEEAEGEVEATIEGDLDPVLALLASTALQVWDPDFFDPPAVATVAEADRDAASQRALLEAHLDQRQATGAIREAALDAFDTMPAEVVTSPKLRAALAALTGTFAEPAIDAFLTGQNCTGAAAARIAFEVPPGDSELVARVTYTANGARVVSINPFAEGERFEQLMPILAHEAVHCDQRDSLAEEVAATAFDGFLYLNLVVVDPSLAAARTRVARELNVDAIALINSGARFPESIGVLQSAGVAAVLPGTTVGYRSFAEFIVAAYPQVDAGTSPPETTAVRYAETLARGSGTDAGDPFDLRYLDELLGRAMEAWVLAEAIRAFELAPAG